MNLQSQGAYIRLRELNQIPVVPHSLSLSRVALRVKRWKALASCHCSYRRHCPFSPRRDNTAAAPRGVNPLSLRYPRETASIGPLSLSLSPFVVTAYAHAWRHTPLTSSRYGARALARETSDAGSERGRERRYLVFNPFSGMILGAKDGEREGEGERGPACAGGQDER